MNNPFSSKSLYNILKHIPNKTDPCLLNKAKTKIFKKMFSTSVNIYSVMFKLIEPNFHIVLIKQWILHKIVPEVKFFKLQEWKIAHENGILDFSFFKLYLE